MEDYLSFEIINVHLLDPLQWWKEKQVRWPILSRMANRFLCINASSVAVERLWSHARGRDRAIAVHPSRQRPYYYYYWFIVHQPPVSKMGPNSRTEAQDTTRVLANAARLTRNKGLSVPKQRQ